MKTLPTTMSKRSIVALLLGLTLVGQSYSQTYVEPVYSPTELSSLLGKTLLNENAVLTGVGWGSAAQTSDPYPSSRDPYNVNINRNVNCYAFFYDRFDRSSYKLLGLLPSQANALGSNGANGGNVCSAGSATVASLVGAIPACQGLTGSQFTTCFAQECVKTVVAKSHLYQCGACSNLQDLHTYLTVTDLTNPVRSCGIQDIFGADLIECIQDLGFTLPCSRIWAWNTENTRKLNRRGGCFGVCLAYINADALEPNERLLYGSPCDPSVCFTTINNQPTCQPQSMWQDGSPLRINACLQCDECRSGPLFQKIAARTRRGSGIISAIPRDELGLCTDCVHRYGLNSVSASPTRQPTRQPTKQPTNAPVAGPQTQSPTRNPTTRSPTHLPTQSDAPTKSPEGEEAGGGWALPVGLTCGLLGVFGISFSAIVYTKRRNKAKLAVVEDKNRGSTVANPLFVGDGGAEAHARARQVLEQSLVKYLSAHASHRQDYIEKVDVIAEQTLSRPLGFDKLEDKLTRKFGVAYSVPPELKNPKFDKDFF